MKNYDPMFDEVKVEILARLKNLTTDVEAARLPFFPSPSSLRMAEWFKLLADLEEVQMPGNWSCF